MAISPLAFRSSQPTTTPFDEAVQAHISSGRYQEAAKLLAERYRRRRDRGDAEHLSAVLALAGEFAKAADILLTLIDFQPTNADLHDRLADVYHQWGRPEQAEEARRAAVIFNRAKQVVAKTREPNGWAGRC